MFRDESTQEPFANVTLRVGRNGSWDDLLLVQFMLYIVFSRTNVAGDNPIPGDISVTGKPAADTPILIAAFQKHVMKRAKPQGYIDQATGKNKHLSTIYQLNRVVEQYVQYDYPEDTLFGFISWKLPLLEPMLKIKTSQPMYEKQDTVGELTTKVGIKKSPMIKMIQD